MFPQFASRLIRNGATLGGNLATASPIGDAAPGPAGAGGRGRPRLGRRRARGRPCPRFFTGYRQTVRRPGELIRAVRIPLPLSEITAFHKIAKRRFDDISSVAVGFALDVRDGVVVRARIGLGGVGGHARAGAAPPSGARGSAVGRRRPSGSRPPGAAPRRARRSTTTGPARPTARPCSAPRCRRLYAEHATAVEVGA